MARLDKSADHLRAFHFQIMSTVIERVRLCYRAGRSDKVYEIELIAECDGLFHVVGYNGRRGAQLVAQPKTQRGVPLATARRIFDALEQAKLNHRKTPYHVAGRETLVEVQNERAPSIPQQNEQRQAADDYRAGYLDALEF